MRKLFLVMMCSALLFGCTSKARNNDVNAANTAYAGYYKAIDDNSRFQSDSLYYDVEAEMIRMSDGTYRYYITIDNPQIAMYYISVLAVADHVPYENANAMMPSIGIYESEKYHMIPFQTNANTGYVKGLVISGESDHENIPIQMLVEWYDRTRENQRREFLEFEMNLSGIVVPEDSVVVEETEQPVEEETENE
ncbi:MAG: hypothetical protein J6D29_08220 [Solobacterium sp.]|nr:hypothetical protein [Solobacterium sp.]